MSYASAGEISPTVTLEWNRIVGNGRHMYGNFSTTTAAVNMDLQNMQYLFFTVSMFSSFTCGDILWHDLNTLPD